MAAADPSARRERADIPEDQTWDLSRIYPDWEAWERDFAAVSADLEGIAALSGSLGRSAAALLGATERVLDARHRLERVHVYAHLRSDEDTRIGAHTERKGRADTLGVRFAEAACWYDPELLALDDAALAAFRAAEPGLALYDHHFADLRRSRPHTLPPSEEALLAATGQISRGAATIFGALDNADLVFPAIRDEAGREVALTKARYQKFSRSRDRRVREENFRVFLDTYGRHRNTLAATLDANVKNHVFFARARRHAGTLEAALHRNAVPVPVYHNLVAAVRAQLPLVHRYTRLKRRVLALDELRDHDLTAPMFPDGEPTYTYEESCGLLREALAPLGEEYLEVVRRGLAERWIDVHENAGKRSGAYSSGIHGTDPYILLNWSGQLRDTFTLAHEMGHSLHSWMATHSQPYVYSDYPIFTAEVASTFNELLLQRRLLATTTDPARRLSLLDNHLDQILGTVVRQTMFAEFELAVHRIGEQDGTLTADRLDGLYLDLLRDYWGPEVVLDEARSARTWSRVPHFYYNYYVYQYATAFSASTALVRRVLEGGATEREEYLGFLRSGCSRHPVETLLRAGVDVTTDEPVRDVFLVFGALMDEMEALLAVEDRR
jgi:oligoendopeptidase F